MTIVVFPGTKEYFEKLIKKDCCPDVQNAAKIVELTEWGSNA